MRPRPPSRQCQGAVCFCGGFSGPVHSRPTGPAAGLALSPARHGRPHADALRCRSQRTRPLFTARCLCGPRPGVRPHLDGRTYFNFLRRDVVPEKNELTVRYRVIETLIRLTRGSLPKIRCQVSKVWVCTFLLRNGPRTCALTRSLRAHCSLKETRRTARDECCARFLPKLKPTGTEVKSKRSDNLIHNTVEYKLAGHFQISVV